MPVKSGYLLVAGGGAVLLYSGIKGKAWTATLKNVLSGKSAAQIAASQSGDTPILTAAQAYSVANPGGVPASSTGTSTGSAIADDAMRYAGTWQYVWGGAPGSGQRGDCSSFTNAVIGRDLSLAIPLYKAGAYHGQAHGPNTLIWLAWSGCFTIKRKDVVAGDLAVWQTHMGIFTGNNSVVSALNPSDGVKNLTLAQTAPFGEVLVCRRLKAVTVRG